MFHNMQKKEKIYIGIIAGLVVVIAGLLIAFVIASNNSHNKNTNIINEQSSYIDNDRDNNEYKDKTEYSLEEQKQKDNACGAMAQFVKSNTWESNGRKYAQIDVTIENMVNEKIDDWNIRFSVGKNTELEQKWNCDIKEEYIDEDKWYTLTPVEYNKVINNNEKTQGIGFIISSDEIRDITEYELTSNISGEQKDYRQEALTNEIQSIETDKLNEYEYSSNDTGDREVSYTTEYNRSAVGALHVEGTHLVDDTGNYVQLRGVSTHGLAWYPQYVNIDAFKTLRDDWNVNVIRLAMYTAEYGGYCSGGDRQALKELIDKGVKYTSELGMYVIIDWHILSDYNPNQNKDEAVSFFSEMAEKYSGYNNVIYEICNEPQNSDWNTVIKPYAEEVINSIRRFDNDAVIIVGTNTWSQDVDSVIGNEINDENIMYALHFYAGTHKDWIRNKLIQALDSGVPVIVSECSICDASGNGGIDYDSAQQWLDLLNSKGVSIIAWSLSNKNETSALINPFCDKLSDWNEDELSDAGRWFRNAFKG